MELNTSNEDSAKPSPPNETSGTEDAEKCEDISVFDLETFQKQLSRLDGKKQKTTIVSTDTTNIPGPSCETDKIGDDTNKKVQNIVCECEPNVAGAAVAAVSSFNNPPTQNFLEATPESQAVTKSDVAEKSESSKTESPTADITKKSMRIYHLLSFKGNTVSFRCCSRKFQ